jgi:hypothetical protein
MSVSLLEAAWQQKEKEMVAQPRHHVTMAKKKMVAQPSKKKRKWLHNQGIMLQWQ